MNVKASIYTSLDYIIIIHVHVPSDVLVQLVLEVNEAVVAGLHKDRHQHNNTIPTFRTLICMPSSMTVWVYSLV